MVCPVNVLCRMLLVMLIVCLSFAPSEMTRWAPLWYFLWAVIAPSEVADCLKLCFFYWLRRSYQICFLICSKSWVLDLQIPSTEWLALDVILRLLWDLLRLGKFGDGVRCWRFNSGGYKMHCFWYSFYSCFYDVCCLASIVERRWDKVTNIDTVRYKCKSLACFFMYNDFYTWWC